MKPSSDLKKRTAWYILGLNLIAAAVVLNIRYNVGVAAFSSVMYAISEIYHISLGTASILCYLLFVVLQCILSRKITLTYLLEIPLSFAFGILTYRRVRLAHSRATVSAATAAALLCADDVHHRRGRVPLRQEPHGAYPDRWHREHDIRGVSSAVFHRQERV